MQVIPLQAIPNQSFNIVLGEYNCILHLYQRGEYMYLDLTADSVVIRQGAICLVDVDILNYKNNNFDGYLFFSDLMGLFGIPNYSELGNRYVLFFATKEEIENV